MNAVRNGDLHRAMEIIQGIHDQCSHAGTADEGNDRGRYER